MSVWTPPRRWLPPRRHWQLAVPPRQRDWLRASDSLTQRLQALAGGDFCVQLLAQHWARPAPEEARRLRLPPGRYALIREVALHGQGQVWVRARSVVPAASLRGAGRRLQRLGQRSLGSLLFRDPGLRRSPIEICRLQQPEGQVFARRSQFIYHGHPLLVAECFLPALAIAAAALQR